MPSTVLIVDDSPTLRQMVKASLSDLAEARLVEAGNGLEAIERLAIGTVDLVVLDLNMPDLPGIDVLRFMRAHDRYRDVPVIVLTTRGDQASREAAMTAGAQLYLTKPFTPTMLCRHAERLMAIGAGADDDR